MRLQTGEGASPAAQRRTLTPVLLGVVLGSAWQLQQPSLWPIADYRLLTCAALLAWGLGLVFQKQLRLSALLRDGTRWLLVVALAFGVTGWRAGSFASHALNPALEGRDITVSGVVASLPQRFDGGVRFRLKLEAAQIEAQPVVLPQRLELAWYAGEFRHELAPEGQQAVTAAPPGPMPVQAGERWRLTVRLKAPHGSVNPHGFDYELWQWEQGVQASGYVRNGAKDPPPQRLASTWQYPLERLRQQQRQRIDATLSDPGAAALVAALMLGDQAAIARADWEVFRATGVAHLMSISGLHITMFAWLAAALTGALWRRSPALCLRLSAPGAGLIGGVLLALAYALFSGWGVPAQRTLLMLASVGLLRLAGLRWPWPQVWLLACAVVVAADPWALLQSGFWLSFVAVGILFASDGGSSPAGAVRLTERARALLREQWVITLALAPLSLLLFGQVSLVGLLANALAIPWVTLLVTPLAMLGSLLPGAWTLAGGAMLWLLEGLRWLASWPWAVLSVAQAPLWAGAAGVLGGALLVLRLPWSLRLTSVPLLLPVLLWQPLSPAPGQFALLAADVGQGSAVLVRTARHALLFDAGPRLGPASDAGQRVLVPLLRALGVRLDALMLSHQDNDHAGGAPAVLLMQPQAQLLSSLPPDHPLQTWQTRAGASAKPPGRCEAGQHWQWDGVDFEVLHPAAADYATAPKTNALSCVLRIANGTQTALLAGDIEVAQEARLVRSHTAEPLDARPGLRTDVLLAPHHGSKTSSSALFLDAVQPRIVMVQAGYRNRFGHPHGPVLVRYVQHDAHVVDTPHCGAISWQSNQAAAVQCQRELDRRYWHHQVP